MLKMTQIIPFVVGALLMTSTASEGAAKSSVPAREEINDQYKWKLSDMYASDELWQSDFDNLKQTLSTVSKYKGSLTTSAENVADCFQLRDQIGITAGKLYAFARMHRDENSANSKYQAMTGKVDSLLAEAGAATAFVEPELLALPDEKLNAFRRHPRLAQYSFYFENLLRQKKHILSPAEEELLSRASEVTQASQNTFTMLARADMKFPQTIDESGNQVQLSEGRYRSFIMSPDRKVRQQAFQGLFNTYGQFRNTFAATLSGNVKQTMFYAKARKYDSALAAALESDNVPTEVYDNLIATVSNNLAPLHRYVALKKKFLNLTDIHMYDLYAPLGGDTKLTIPYSEALELVKTGLKPLGDDYAANLQTGLTSGWIDVYENQGKQSGAYSWGTYGSHPFVLLNYNNRYDDVSTLAHEMGHALHSHYSHTTQPYSTSSYTIFTAEVASTTNEVLLMDYMLNKTTDKRQRLYLLNQQIEAIRATVYRQTLFAEFEKIIYSKAESGESITADMLESIWHDLNVKYYGTDIVVDKEIDIEWARIPHFYRSFYVYQYVTGYSAATALATQILTEGIPAQERYLSFLKSGGSDYSLEILKRAGVDMSSPAPIEITLRKFSDLLDELEKVLAES